MTTSRRHTGRHRNTALASDPFARLSRRMWGAAGLRDWRGDHLSKNDSRQPLPGAFSQCRPNHRADKERYGTNMCPETIGRLNEQSSVRRCRIDDVTFTFVVDGAMSIAPQSFLSAIPADY